MNKSIGLEIGNGEICMSTKKHKIYFDGGILSPYIRIYRMWGIFVGISSVKRKK